MPALPESARRHASLFCLLPSPQCGQRCSGRTTACSGVHGEQGPSGLLKLVTQEHRDAVFFQFIEDTGYRDKIKVRAFSVSRYIGVRFRGWAFLGLN